MVCPTLKLALVTICGHFEKARSQLFSSQRSAPFIYFSNIYIANTSLKAQACNPNCWGGWNRKIWSSRVLGLLSKFKASLGDLARPWVKIKKWSQSRGKILWLRIHGVQSQVQKLSPEHISVALAPGSHVLRTPKPAQPAGVTNGTAMTSARSCLITALWFQELWVWGWQSYFLQLRRTGP